MNVKDKKVFTESGKLQETESIIRIEEVNDETVIFLTDGSKVRSVLSIDELEWELPKDIFIRVHPKHLINKKYSKKYFTVNTRWIELEGGKKIPITEELSENKIIYKKGNGFLNWIEKIIK